MFGPAAISVVTAAGTDRRLVRRRGTRDEIDVRFSDRGHLQLVYRYTVYESLMRRTSRLRNGKCIVNLNIGLRTGISLSPNDWTTSPAVTSGPTASVVRLKGRQPSTPQSGARTGPHTDDSSRPRRWLPRRLLRGRRSCDVLVGRAPGGPDCRRTRHRLTRLRTGSDLEQSGCTRLGESLARYASARRGALLRRPPADPGPPLHGIPPSPHLRRHVRYARSFRQVGRSWHLRVGPHRGPVPPGPTNRNYFPQTSVTPGNSLSQRVIREACRRRRVASSRGL